jgi:hypothetical protein
MDHHEAPLIERGHRPRVGTKLTQCVGALLNAAMLIQRCIPLMSSSSTIQQPRPAGLKLSGSGALIDITSFDRSVAQNIA